VVHHVIHAALDVAGTFLVIGAVIGMIIAHFAGRLRRRGKAA
jgi:uncharacterized membrane-anchored protein YhcB (DUF1043 family)